MHGYISKWCYSLCIMLSVTNFDKHTYVCNFIDSNQTLLAIPECIKDMK